jgi:predicted alpha/beta-fold hydrolase
LKDKYRILSFDYRGHGQSSKTGPYSFKQLVEDIEIVRMHFTENDDNFVLCGGSFGGWPFQILLKRETDNERLPCPAVRLDIPKKIITFDTARYCTVVPS